MTFSMHRNPWKAMSAITTLLLDRDGTIIKDKHYLADPEGVELFPGVAEVLAAAISRGMRLFLVSNQSGIGRGMFSHEAAEAVNERLACLLRRNGVVFTDMMICPHAPDAECDCRKPATGMWRELSRRHGLEAGKTLMLGDKEEDILFAANAGLAMRGLVLTGKGQATLDRLHLAGPGASGFRYSKDARQPSQPHLVLASLASLEAFFNSTSSSGSAMEREGACGA